MKLPPLRDFRSSTAADPSSTIEGSIVGDYDPGPMRTASLLGAVKSFVRSAGFLCSALAEESAVRTGLMRVGGPMLLTFVGEMKAMLLAFVGEVEEKSRPETLQRVEDLETRFAILCDQWPAFDNGKEFTDWRAFRVDWKHGHKSESKLVEFEERARKIHEEIAAEVVATETRET